MFSHTALQLVALPKTIAIAALRATNTIFVSVILVINN